MKRLRIGVGGRGLSVDPDVLDDSGRVVGKAEWEDDWLVVYLEDACQPPSPSDK